VKQVVLPMGGQSYNPSAKDHQEVIQQVVAEELLEVKELQRRLRTLKPHLFKEDSKSAEVAIPISEGVIKKKEGPENTEELSVGEADDSDNSDIVTLERVNKAVSRLTKLTRAEKNLKLIKRLKHNAQEDQRKVKKWNKDFNKIPTMITDTTEKAV